MSVLPPPVEVFWCVQGAFIDIYSSMLRFAAQGAETGGRLTNLVKRAGFVQGCTLEVADRRMVVKLLSILENPSHRLHHTVDALSSTLHSYTLLCSLIFFLCNIQDSVEHFCTIFKCVL